MIGRIATREELRMTSEQWLRVKSIASDAWTQSPPAREAFAAHACGGDEVVLREVLSLLDSMDQAGDRFERSALDAGGADAIAHLVVGAALDGATVEMTGRRIGPYEI